MWLIVFYMILQFGIVFSFLAVIYIFIFSSLFSCLLILHAQFKILNAQFMQRMNQVWEVKQTVDNTSSKKNLR